MFKNVPKKVSFFNHCSFCQVVNSFPSLVKSFPLLFCIFPYYSVFSRIIPYHFILFSYYSVLFCIILYYFVLFNIIYYYYVLFIFTLFLLSNGNKFPPHCKKVSDTLLYYQLPIQNAHILNSSHLGSYGGQMSSTELPPRHRNFDKK